jgi:hypothetical protein
LALSAGVAAILAGLTVWDRERIQDDASVVQISASPAPLSKPEAVRAVR